MGASFVSGFRKNVPITTRRRSKDVGIASFCCEILFCSNAFEIVDRKFVYLIGLPFAENLRCNAYYTKKFLWLKFEVHLQLLSSPLT